MVKNWRTITLVLILFLAVMPVLGPLLRGDTLGPQIWTNPNNPAPRPNFNVLHADGTLQTLPWRTLVLESWASGKPATWNPYQGFGLPLLANSQSAVYYPPHILLGVLRVPIPLAITLLAAFHLILAALGARALARRFNLSEDGATVAAVFVASSAFFLEWIPLGSVIATCAFIPWVLAHALSLADPTARRRKVALLTLCLACLILSGHLQFAIFGLFALGILSLLLLAQSSTRAALPWIIGSGLLAALLTTPHWRPVLALSQSSHRSTVPTPEGYAAYRRLALQPYELPALVSSSLMGSLYISLPTEEPGAPNFPTYWPASQKPGAHPAESAITLGPLGIALLALLRRKHFTVKTAPNPDEPTDTPTEPSPAPAVIFGLTTLLFGFFIALGTPITQLLYFNFPGWAASGNPGRAAVLMVFGMAILAAALFPSSPRRATRNEQIAVGVAALVSLFAWIQLPSLAIASIPPGAPQVLSNIVAAAQVNALPTILITLLFAAGALLSPTVQQRILMVFAGAVFTFATHIVPSHATLPLVASPDPKTRVAFVSDTWNLFEHSATSVMPPNLATLNRAPSTEAYDSLIPRQTAEFFTQLNAGQSSSPPANGNMFGLAKTASPEAAIEAGIATVISAHTIQSFESAGIQPVLDGRLRIYKLPAKPLVELDGTPLTEWTLDTQGITITLPPNATGTLTARWLALPGWTASLDGNPIPIPSATWLSSEITTPGAVLRFQYTPPNQKQ